MDYLLSGTLSRYFTQTHSILNLVGIPPIFSNPQNCFQPCHRVSWLNLKKPHLWITLIFLDLWCFDSVPNQPVYCRTPLDTFMSSPYTYALFPSALDDQRLRLCYGVCVMCPLSSFLPQHMHLLNHLCAVLDQAQKAHTVFQTYLCSTIHSITLLTLLSTPPLLFCIFSQLPSILSWESKPLHEFFFALNSQVMQ